MLDLKEDKLGFISIMNNLERKFSWSLFGFVLAVFFGSLTIYIEFFKLDTPYLTTEILSETNVLSFNEEVKELKVLWGDIDIKNLEKTISVVTIRVKNDGGASLLKDYYDSDYPVTILVENAQVMEVELMSASSKYLKDKALMSFYESKIFLPKVILDQGNNYVFKVLLLHGNSINPKFSIIGKIASIEELGIEFLNEDVKEGFWSVVFSGNLWVQIARVPFYLLGFIFFLLLTFIPIIIASEFIFKRKRKRVIKKYKEMNGVECEGIQDYIFNLYLDNGISDIEKINFFISDDNNLLSYIEMSNKYLNEEYREGYYLLRRYKSEDLSYQNPERESSFEKYHIYSLLHKSSVIEVQFNVAKVKEGASELISDFLKFVKIREI